MPFPNYTKEEIIDDIYGNTICCKHCEYQDFYAYRKIQIHIKANVSVLTTIQ